MTVVSESQCLFCRIISGEEPAEKVFETGEFLAIANKYPTAPVHVLVLDKEHREKPATISGSYRGYWDKMMAACYQVIKQLGLDKEGYKLVNNGAGYNHFEHEHMHILGGGEEEPDGKT